MHKHDHTVYIHDMTVYMHCMYILHSTHVHFIYVHTQYIHVMTMYMHCMYVSCTWKARTNVLVTVGAVFIDSLYTYIPGIYMACTRSRFYEHVYRAIKKAQGWDSNPWLSAYLLADITTTLPAWMQLCESCVYSNLIYLGVGDGRQAQDQPRPPPPPSWWRRRPEHLWARGAAQRMRRLAGLPNFGPALTCRLGVDKFCSSESDCRAATQAP